MRNQNFKRTAFGGFTIIELMVAMLITAIIVVGVYAFATNSSSQFNREMEVMQNTSNASIAESLVQRDIQRAGFRSSLDTAADPLIRVQGGTDFLGISFSLIAASGSIPAHHRIRIVGDISDYETFTVSSLSGSTLTLEPILNLPPDPAALQNGSFVRSPATPEQIKEAFYKSFSQAPAIRISSSGGKSIVTGINSIDVENLSINITGYTFDANDGFIDASLSQSQVNPIFGIQYDLGLSQNLPSLRRCTFDPRQPNLPLDCVFILEGLEYLAFLPFSLNQSIANLHAQLALKSSEILESWKTFSQNTQVSQLNSVYFRFALISPKVQRNITVSAAALAERVAPPYHLDSEGRSYILSHVQGTSTIYSRLSNADSVASLWQ